MEIIIHDLTKSDDDDNDDHYCSDMIKSKKGSIGSFLDGTIRLTSNNNTAQDELTISFDEIFQADGLQKCLLTAYVIDPDWLLPKLKDCPNTLLCFDDGDRPGGDIFKVAENVRVIKPKFPKNHKFGVMHAKLMLLQYANGYLRIVISSANLVPYDYDKVQNMVFIQDCPKLTGKDVVPKEELEFITDLSRMLHDLGIYASPEIAEEYKEFDYSKTRPKIVFSSPFSQTLKRPSGLLMLAEKIPKPFNIPSCLECQGSSLGAMEMNWLNLFIEAASGSLLSSASSTMKDIEVNCKRNLLQTDTTDPPKPSTTIKVVFPTMEFVNTSPLGPNGFGTIFCRAQNWSKSSYPRSFHHKCISSYGKGQPLHTKIITALDQTDKEAWWYIGSANFTPSAWGRPNKQRDWIFVANYELGIVFGVDDIKTLCPLGFPYPYTRPLESYTKDDLPWMQDEHYSA